MTRVYRQALEESGDPGGNRTRDNLIKSHILSFLNQLLTKEKIVKPVIGCQWVTRKLSNLFNPPKPSSSDRGFDPHASKLSLALSRPYAP